MPAHAMCSSKMGEVTAVRGAVVTLAAQPSMGFGMVEHIGLKDTLDVLFVEDAASVDLELLFLDLVRENKLVMSF